MKIAVSSGPVMGTRSSSRGLIMRLPPRTGWLASVNFWRLGVAPAVPHADGAVPFTQSGLAKSLTI